MSSNRDNLAFKMPEILDLAAAEGFLASMLNRLREGGLLRIDASAVDTLTYPCIQVVLAALRTYDRISIERPSLAFTRAFEDLAIDWMAEQARASPQPIEKIENIEDVETQITNRDQPPIDPQIDSDQPDESAMPKRILTIDDSKTMRDMLMLTLADAGFDVLQAVDGQDGLDVLARERVDVVITDINMPRMDGYEVIRQLRSHSDHKTTPILVLTTESEAEKRNLAREAGATG